MRINRLELKKALETVKPGLAGLTAGKDIEEQFTSFAFLKDKLVTYNDEISVSYPIEIGFEGAIQANELYKYILKLKEEEIELTLTESEVVLKAGRSMSGFILLKDVNLPIEEELAEKGKWVDIPENFLDYIVFASQACSRNPHDAKLTCVHVDTEKGFIEGCDNHRIVRCEVKPIKKVDQFLIPYPSAKIISQFAPVKMSRSEAWVHFKTKENAIISCRTFMDTYVDLDQFLKPPKKNNIVTIPTNLDEILDRAIIFSKRDNVNEESVEVEVSNKKVIVKSNSDRGWFKESSPIKFAGEPFVFKITPYLLKDIIKKTTTFNYQGQSLLFTSDDWVYFTTLRVS